MLCRRANPLSGPPHAMLQYHVLSPLHSSLHCWPFAVCNLLIHSVLSFTRPPLHTSLASRSSVLRFSELVCGLEQSPSDWAPCQEPWSDCPQNPSVAL